MSDLTTLFGPNKSNPHDDDESASIGRTLLNALKRRWQQLRSRERPPEESLADPTTGPSPGRSSSSILGDITSGLMARRRSPYRADTPKIRPITEGRGWWSRENPAAETPTSSTGPAAQETGPDTDAPRINDPHRGNLITLPVRSAPDDSGPPSVASLQPGRTPLSIEPRPSFSSVPSIQFRGIIYKFTLE